MSKIFYLLPSILMAGKLIASDPAIHPGYNFNEDLSSAQPVRIPTQPVLPIGIPTTIFPIDQGISNPVVNPVVSDPVIDDALGIDRPKPALLPLVVTPATKPEVPIAKDEPVVVKPVAPAVQPATKPQAALVPGKPASDDSDDSDLDNIVSALVDNTDLFDEDSSSDEDDIYPGKKPAINVVQPDEATRLNGSDKPRGMISRFFNGCFSIVCMPFRFFLWCCGCDSATSDTKKSN
ncbi:MAG: hypothetical protein NT128_01075 [Proteobacteria bacterium]|nr:hypothetical protein [Pseudomonadota bacterium]